MNNKKKDMTNSKDTHKHVTTLLLQGRLKQAMNALAEVAKSDSDWELYTRFTQMQSAYNYMLEYLRTDMPDPNSRKLYHELVGQCLIINDETALVNGAAEEHRYFMQYRNKYKNILDVTVIHRKLADNAANIAVAHMIPAPESHKVKQELTQQHEELLKEAFYRMWTSTNWKSYTCEDVYSMFTDKDIPANDTATLISAITLGLLKCFEPQKAILLCRLSMTDDKNTSTRALIGLLMVLSIFEERLEYYPELLYAIESLNDDEKTKRRIQTIQIQLMRCRETQKIDKKMREVIIPAMMKNPHIRNGKLGMEVDIDDIEHNPEWENWADKESIKEKLNEMAQWQLEGADVYMSTFSQLKRFPFFEEVYNWLRPFDKSVPEVSTVIPDSNTKNSILNAICSSRFFCNSDKYSFCFTLKQIPEEQRHAMMQQIPDSQSEEDSPDTMSQAPKEKESETLGNQYIQDLYRFFKLSRYRQEFTDPFALSPNLLESKHLAFLVNDKHSVMQTFNYLVEKEYYTEATHAGFILEKSKNSDAQFYQKMGYCMQKTENYRQAIDYYTKADIVMPDSLWTIRRMAQCYRMLGEFDYALHYHMAAEQIKPEDAKLLLQTGECLAILKRYDEAFSRFFKVEYINPESLHALRAIAWCSFLTQNDKQAHHYYEKLINSGKAKCEDYMNAAHIEWVNKKHNKAFELYKKAEEICGSTDKLLSMIDADKAVLIERGVSEFELKLLRDLFY